MVLSLASGHDWESRLKALSSSWRRMATSRLRPSLGSSTLLQHAFSLWSSTSLTRWTVEGAIPTSNRPAFPGLGTDPLRWIGLCNAICLLGSGFRPFWAIFFLLVLGTCFRTVFVILYSLCLDSTLFSSSSILLVLRSSFEHFLKHASVIPFPTPELPWVSNLH